MKKIIFWALFIAAAVFLISCKSKDQYSIATIEMFIDGKKPQTLEHFRINQTYNLSAKFYNIRGDELSADRPGNIIWTSKNMESFELLVPRTGTNASFRANLSSVTVEVEMSFVQVEYEGLVKNVHIRYTN